MTEARLALISVSDKTGVVDLARELVAQGFQLVSTGGTLAELWRTGVEARPVSELTGFPEVFGGRVKTLHPAVHGGILYRRGVDEDARARASLGIDPIDLVVVNLYPFRETVARPGITLAEAIEQIDIGGPALIRAAAKNFAHVAVVVDPADYGAVAAELAAHEGFLLRETRERLALKAFRHTASYDMAIARYLAARESPEPLPERLLIELECVQELRYGENPHQKAALYAAPNTPALCGARFLQGKALSYNNLLDLAAALEAVAEHEPPAAVIVKHTNPCGAGLDATELGTAYERALAGDPTSAFGGIVALNRTCDEALGAALAERFFEVVAAPDFTDAALAKLATKKNLRVLRIDPRRAQAPLGARHISLGVLVQERDPPVGVEEEAAWTVATRRQPTPEEWEALRFLWRVCKHVKSNAIVVGSGRQTFGVGAGQMSRIDAVRLALGKAGSQVTGACLASDAFFPFRDSIDEAAAAGIRAVIEPGGSIRDAEVVAAADEHDLALVVTGRRHFRH